MCVCVCARARACVRVCEVWVGGRRVNIYVYVGGYGCVSMRVFKAMRR